MAGHYAKSHVLLTGQGGEEHHRWGELPGHDWGARGSRGLARGRRCCCAAVTP